MNSHLRAVLQALFVTFLWSTSWVLIKIGLSDIPALTFAGLRYCLAFAFLLVYARGSLRALRGRSRRLWVRLIALGLVYYSVTQGTQFIGLSYLPAATVTLLLSFSAVAAMLLGMWLLKERPTRQQVAGMAIYLIGVVVYFYPAVLPRGQVIGVVVVLIGVLANAYSAVLGRDINRSGDLPPALVTTVSMGFGAPVMLIAGIAAQGMPTLSADNWLIIAVLALVNTAFAFTLWNHTLRTLTATESSVINNMMLIQIPILAWIFLGETINAQQAAGMALAGAGILVVQARRGAVSVQPSAISEEAASGIE